MKDFNHPFIIKINIIEQKLDELIRRLKLQDQKSVKLQLLSTKDILSFFQIDSKTAKMWRDSKILKFIKIKGKLFYQYSDIEELINQSKSNSNE